MDQWRGGDGKTEREETEDSIRMLGWAFLFAIAGLLSIIVFLLIKAGHSIYWLYNYFLSL